MPYKKKIDFYFAIVSITYFVMAFPVSLAIQNHFVGNELQKIERVMQRNISLVRSNFEASIFMDTFLADSLATFVTIDPDLAFTNWENIAQQLMMKAQNVRNVTASPNNVISYIYPLEGNESALGVDLSRIPEQNKAIQLAKQYQHIYIDGPVELVQGGQGLIARYPIFSDYPHNQDYWGTVSVVIDFDRLLEQSGLYDLIGTDVAIKNITDTPKLIYGNIETFEHSDIQQIINLPFGKWQIGAKFKLSDSSHISFIEKTVTSVLFVAVLLIYALIFLLYRNYQMIQMAAMQDELTHLPNRRHINKLLKKLTEGKDNKTPFTILSIDVNDFKDVNDNYGHDVGDKFLKFIAAKLNENVRQTDTVARMGGDEFLVVLRNIYQVDQIHKVISSIKNKIESEPFYHFSEKIYPSLSIGHATSKDKNQDVDSLMTQADHAMYVQKNANAFSRKE